MCLEPELVRRGGCEIMQGFGTNQGNAAMQHLYFSPVLGARTYKAYIPDQYLVKVLFFFKIFVFGIMQRLAPLIFLP